MKEVGRWALEVPYTILLSYIFEIAHKKLKYIILKKPNTSTFCPENMVVAYSRN